MGKNDDKTPKPTKSRQCVLKFHFINVATIIQIEATEAIRPIIDILPQSLQHNICGGSVKG